MALLFAALEIGVAALGPFRPSVPAIAWIVGLDGLAGLALSLIAARLGRDEVARAGQAAGIVALVLLGVYVAPGIGLLASEGQAGALVLVVAPILVAVAAAVAARRIARWGRADAVLTVAALVLGAVASIAPFAPAPKGTVAADRPDGRSVLLVTVDGLRADAVPPELAALTAGGARFTDAVTPTPGSRAANATVLTGLHPLRHRVLTDRDRLSRAYPTLFEALDEAGWPTAAFVSAAAAGRTSGLAQGFGIFDDGWTGANDAALGRILVDLGVRATDPAGVGRWSSRKDVHTAQQFARWVGRRRGPWAAWVHLADPRRVEAGALDVATTAQAAEVLQAAVGPEVVVVVAGTHGVLAGAHGGRGNVTLFDEVVHVPLALRLPGEAPAVSEVPAQVRTMDLAATVLDALGVEADTETEGVPLTGFATGARQSSIACPLVGQDADGRWLVGVRSDRVKVIAGPDGQESLFLLDDDPGESADRAAEQPKVLAQVRGLLSADRAALAELVR